MKQLISVTIMVGSFLMLFPSPGIASSLLVSWNANTESDLAGYKVYYGGQSGTYDNVVDVEDTTSHVIDNLDNGNTYYIVVTAYDFTGNESGPSIEKSKYIPVPDITPPSGSVIVNSGEAVTPTRVVSLGLNASDAGGSVVGMRFSNDNITFSSEVPYASTQQWVLSEGDGMKNVYVLFKDASGNWMTNPAQDSIEYRLDTDGDGLPDSWENICGLDPLDPDDAGVDSDNDGLSNLEEYLADTDPFDEFDNLPLVSAGPDQQVTPKRVYLNATVSDDPNGDTLVLNWTQSAGPVQVELENDSFAEASFVATKAGLYSFLFNCFDGKASIGDSVDVVVDNVAPSVSAGSDMVIDAGSEIVLHASGADPNDDTLSYLWSFIDGPPIQINNADSRDIALFLDDEGQYRFSVVCSDGSLSSQPDEVVVVVNSINQAPTANAGPDADVQSGTKVYLDGSGSTDPDGDELTCQWTQSSGEVVYLNDSNSLQPWFDAYEEGSYEFELVVSDTMADSIPDTVLVRVLKLNNAPIADAGEDIQVFVGNTVILNSTASYDPDDDALTYIWSQTSGAEVDIIGNKTSKASFTPTTSGVLGFKVVVSDGKVCVEDSVVVTVEGVNSVPFADAGEDISADVGDTIILDGSLSSDPDGDNISYIWSQTKGTLVSLSSSNSVNPSFVPTAEGIYVFELKVYDGKDTSTADTVTVNVDTELSCIELYSPQAAAEITRSPVFTWSSYTGVNKYKLYLSINNGRFRNVYVGSETSYILHKVLWRWFMPSGTKISWYVEGYTSDSTITSAMQYFIKM